MSNVENNGKITEVARTMRHKLLHSGFFFKPFTKGRRINDALVTTAKADLEIHIHLRNVPANASSNVAG